MNEDVSPANRALVAQFRPEADRGRGRLEGRAEQVGSGERARSRSADELVRLVTLRRRGPPRRAYRAKRPNSLSFTTRRRSHRRKEIT